MDEPAIHELIHETDGYKVMPDFDWLNYMG
jgi:hypothetical protein